MLTISIKVSTNYVGDRLLLVGNDLYTITATGYLKSIENALLSGKLNTHSFKPCSLISILVSESDKFIELASFNSEDTVVDKKVLTYKEYEEISDGLESKNLWNFVEIKLEYARFVYIFER